MSTFLGVTYIVYGYCSLLNPINTELFSVEELENKMDMMSIEFSSEQYPYTIYVTPRKVDITEHINEQQELKQNLQDEVCIEIVENRIIATNNLVANKNIIENEFYLCIWDKNSENIKENLMKRAKVWQQRFKSCEFTTEILEKKDIILLLKSFTIPEFARKEDTDYRDNIVQIRRKIA